MRCVVISGTANYVVDRVPQPNDPTTCAYVLAAPGELQGNALFQLSIAEAQKISAAIFLVWAVAWGFRQVASLLNNRDQKIEES